VRFSLTCAPLHHPPLLRGRNIIGGAGGAGIGGAGGAAQNIGGLGNVATGGAGGAGIGGAGGAATGFPMCALRASAGS
jgi:hypothetical protein